MSIVCNQNAPSLHGDLGHFDCISNVFIKFNVHMQLYPPSPDEQQKKVFAVGSWKGPIYIVAFNNGTACMVYRTSPFRIVQCKMSRSVIMHAWIYRSVGMHGSFYEYQKGLIYLGSILKGLVLLKPVPLNAPSMTDERQKRLLSTPVYNCRYTPGWLDIHAGH